MGVYLRDGKTGGMGDTVRNHPQRAQVRRTFPNSRGVYAISAVYLCANLTPSPRIISRRKCRETLGDVGFRVLCINDV